MRHRWPILAACLFALAIAMVMLRRDHAPATGSAAGLPVRTDAKPASSAQNASAHSRLRAHTPPPRETRNQDAPAATGRDRALIGKTPARPDPASPTRAELEIRAQSVERDANHELARLIPLLELAPEQQQRVFQALARTSPTFVPGMLVDGTALAPATGNSQQTLLDELSDPQIAAYLEDSNERSAWWSEYINGISSQLDSGTPALGGSAAGVAAVPAADATPPVDTTPAVKEAHAVTGDE